MRGRAILAAVAVTGLLAVSGGSAAHASFGSSYASGGPTNIFASNGSDAIYREG